MRGPVLAILLAAGPASDAGLDAEARTDRAADARAAPVTLQCTSCDNRHRALQRLQAARTEPEADAGE